MVREKSKKLLLIIFLFCVTFALIFLCLPIDSFASSKESFEDAGYKTSYVDIEDGSYKSSYVDIEDLPSSYSLYSFTGFSGQSEGLPNNVGNQYQTDICWAFAANTALESTIYKSGLVDKDEFLNFSEVDMAYDIYIETHDYSQVSGGIFELAYEYLSSERGPVNESDFESLNSSTGLYWDSNSRLTSSYASRLESYTPEFAGFSVLESISFPSRSGIIANASSEEQAESEIEALRNSIKSHIINYGGVTSTLYYSGDCLANNYVYFSSYDKPEANHMVTLVGWDDNFTFNEHKGAYIAQNSYGSSNYGRDGYFYIMYDDAKVENHVSGFLRVGETQEEKSVYSSTFNSEYQDEFVNIVGVNTYAFSFIQQEAPTYNANIFRVDGNSSQKVTRIKLPTLAITRQDSSGKYLLNYDEVKFKVYILNLSAEDVESPERALMTNFDKKIPIKNKYATAGDDEYLFSARQTGYYTVEIDEGVELTEDYFAVIMETQEGIIFHISNNEDKYISSPTYTSSSPNSSWLIYGGITECVLPMIVETVPTYDLEYEIKDRVVTYDGSVCYPDVVVTNVSNYELSFSLDGESFVSESEYNVKDVLRNSQGEVESYIVYVKISAPMYNTLILETQIKILPRSLTVTPNEKVKVYGEVDGSLTYTLSGLAKNESPYPVGRLTRESGEMAGEYNILRGNLDFLSSNSFEKSNYEIEFVSGVKFTISKRPLIVTPTYTSKVYGEKDKEFTYKTSNLYNSEIENLSLVLSREEGEESGKYNFKIESFSLSDNVSTNFYANNYVVVLDSSVQFEVTKRPLVITPSDNLTKVYGEIDTELTFSYSNNLSNEEPIINGKLARESGEDAGYYKINLGSLYLQDNGDFRASNYKLVIVESFYYISHGEITNVEAYDLSVEYDGEYHSLTFDSPSDVRVRFSLSNGFDENLSSDSNIQLKNAGVYYITFEFSKENYYNTYLVRTLEIKRKDLVVVPRQNQSRYYGDSNNIEFSYTGNIEGESPLFSGSLGKETGESVGNYLINRGDLGLCDNETFLSSNYNLVFENLENITYEITPRPLIITPNEVTKFYGKSDPIITYKYTGLCFNDVLSVSGTLKRESGENVGEYLISLGSLSLRDTLSINYKLVLSETSKYFEILPIDLTIIIQDKESYYGELDFNYSYNISADTIENYVGGDNLGLTYICVDENNQEINNTTLRNEDGYEILATSTNKNYNVSVIPGRHYIKYRIYDVTFVVFNISSTIQVEHFGMVERLPEGLSTDVDGYNFIGFTINGNLVNVFSQEITSDTTFVAEFEAIEYSITYILNGGELENAKSEYTIEESFTLSVPTKTGYEFDGWYLESDFSGEEIKEIKAGNFGNKVLYAKYSIIVLDITPPIENSSFSFVGKSNIEYGEDYIFEVKLDRKFDKSYSTLRAFVLWGDSSEREELKRFETGIISEGQETGFVSFIVEDVDSDFEIELEGITLNVYQVEFVANGEIVKEIDVSHGGNVDLEQVPQVPARENYDQVEPKWEDVSLQNVQDDMIVNALYTPNVYTVTFVVNNDKSFDVNVTYGDVVDTSILYNEYDLGVFDYFEFDSNLQNIDSNKVINVEIKSNIYILYIVLAVLGVLCILLIVLWIIRKKKRDKFDWWVYSK